jgi:hypothetical protein
MDANYDRDEVTKELDEFEKLFERLETLTFTATRQHRFLNQQMEEGEGVSFTMQGSIDGIRSKCDDFLAVANSSTNLPADMVAKSIKAYFRDYTGADGTGKTFIQKLAHGPLASITILNQNAAVLELALNFKKLMAKLEKRKMRPVQETLVHPYSFLRNVLWMSTFRGKWLKNQSTKEYAECFDIPDKVINMVFGKPSAIAQAKVAVSKDGSMTGVPLSRYDTATFDSLAFLKPVEKLKPDQLEERMRGQIHIPDMLMINWLRAESITKANEDEEDDTADMIFDDLMENINVDEEYDPLKDIYPKSIWSERLKKINITSIDLYFPEATAPSDPPNGLTRIQKKRWRRDNAVREIVTEPWKNALVSWKKYIDLEHIVEKSPDDDDEDSEFRIDGGQGPPAPGPAPEPEAEPPAPEPEAEPPAHDEPSWMDKPSEDDEDSE